MGKAMWDSLPRDAVAMERLGGPLLFLRSPWSLLVLCWAVGGLLSVPSDPPLWTSCHRQGLQAELGAADASCRV